MAKRRRKHRKGVGSIITVRPSGFAGLGRLRGLRGFNGLASQAIPAALGLGAAAVTFLGIRHFANPVRSETEAKVWKFAPLLGLGAGAAAAFLLSQVGGKAAAVGALTGAVGATLLTLGQDGLQHTGMFAPSALSGYGMGAVVPEMLSRGMGAVVLEPRGTNSLGAGGVTGLHSIGYQGGEVVNLGAINSGAFGTPGFSA